MNLDSICTSAQLTLKSISLKCLASLLFPLFMIWGHLPFAPKMAQFPPASFRKPFTSTFFRTILLIATTLYFKTTSTIYTLPCLNMRFPPSASKVTYRRTISIMLPAFRYIELLPAIYTYFVMAVAWHWPRQALYTLIPRYLFALICTSGRTILSFSTATKFLATYFTCMHNLFHNCSIPQVWLQCKYAQMARDRIVGDAPMLAMMEEIR